jgi:phosphate:Na+ symporter
MPVVKMIFEIVGGLGIFLLGMKNMSEGMQAVAGDRMRKLINAVTNNRFVACGVGITITGLIQSSSVTTVMVVGMVNAGLMSLTQAVGVILGADIGTTVTAWILILHVIKYGLPMLGISAFFYLFSNRERLRYSAMAVMGLGMVFFGLQLMKEGLYPIREMPEFLEWFQRFTPNSYFGVLRCCLVGAVVTAIVQSSSATVGITMGLVGTGIINFKTGAALVLGENIGTTVTALLASLGTSTNARRAAYAHVIVKILGVSWITAVFPIYVHIVESIIGLERIATPVMHNGIETYCYAMTAIAISHTGFNIANVIMLLPFTKTLANLLTRIIPDKSRREIPHLKLIDVRMLDAPAMGIAQSKREILNMAELVRKMLAMLRIVVESDNTDEKLEGKIFHREEILDVIQKEVVEFLSELLSGNVPHSVMEAGRKQLRIADEYESVSDYITNILKLNIKMRKAGLRLTEKEKPRIIELHNRISGYIDFINASFENDDVSILAKANAMGDGITHYIKQLRARHLSEVGTEHTSALKSLIFCDVLTAYRRIKDHILNIAETVVGEK